jgi:hypothetical protein
MWQVGFDKDHAFNIPTCIEIEEIVITARLTVEAAVDTALVRIQAPFERHALDPINCSTGLNFLVMDESQSNPSP